MKVRIAVIFLLFSYACLGQPTVLPCNGWLNSSPESFVRTGDLDIKGDQLTIEVIFNRSVSSNNVDGYGFLVSKHTGAGNINYALWPTGCGISTNGSDHLLSDTCPLEVNKNYHVAMVYDGSTLKFYRDGFLKSQTAASGKLANNNFSTTIGQNVPEGGPVYAFRGYINEVRIWKIARTKNQLQDHLTVPLLSPEKQDGLVAYYKFDDLSNKQGNRSWDAKASANVLINATNSICSFTADSCSTLVNSAPLTFSQSGLNVGLVAYYPFTGNDRDSSGNNNNPVFNNTSFGKDRFNKPKGACYFNGKDTYIRIANNSSLCPEEITIVAIVKPTGFYNGPCYNNSILDKSTLDYKPGAYSLRFTAGEFTQGDCKDGDTVHQNFVGMTATNGGNTSQDIYVKLDTWYHVVYTYSKTHSRIFIDGELISSSPAKGAIGKNSEDIFLGKKNNSQYPYWFNGVMDEIRIYNRALSSQEVFDLFTLQSKPPSAQ